VLVTQVQHFNSKGYPLEIQDMGLFGTFEKDT